MLPRILEGRRGFTLVEMAVVIAILGVLAAVATPLLVIYLGGAQERAYEADLGIVQESVDAFFSAPNNFRFQGKNQYPIIGRGETDRTGHTVRTASFDHPDDGTPLTASQRDAVAGNDNPDWNPLGGTQGADLLNAGATPTYKIAWTDDGDGVREILVATSESTRAPDTWTTIQVTREGVTYYVDPRYYFVDMDALVSARLLREVPKSSSLDNSPTGTGSFTYYVDDKGKVQTLPFDFPRTTGFAATPTPTPTPTPAGTLLATITTGPSPGGVAVNPSTNRLYVASGGANAVQVFDATTYALVTSIAVGSDPFAVAVNATTNRIYVAHGSSNTVSVIDGASNAVTATVPVGSLPHDVAVNATTNRIYVTNIVSNTVSVIDGASNAVTATVAVGSSPVGVAVNATTNRIYVGNVGSNTLSVIDGASNAVTATVAAGSEPRGVAVNATTNRIYVASKTGNTVSVIDGASNAVTATVAVGSFLFGVAVNATTNRIYVASTGSNTVSVIDGASNAVTATVPVGANPEGVAVNATTNRIYVANNGSNTVSVIAD